MVAAESTFECVFHYQLCSESELLTINLNISLQHNFCFSF
ncbi:hypothetical protein LINPERHAP1_LOCUS11978, partial [Linum perenne]